jgi:hypothetical protein
MSGAWNRFFDELDRWRDIGRPVDFWWRDDDATSLTDGLRQLIRLSRSEGAPLALAVIPQGALPWMLADGLDGVAILQHGVSHRNGAGEGARKSEFPAGEPVASALNRLASGRERLEQVFGEHFLPVLVPPWNRISQPDLVAALDGAGFHGLSRFGARSLPAAASGLVQVNTHVDLIDWQGTRGFAGEDVVLGLAVRHLQARREARVDPDEPTGWLTHHAVHDAATWRFMQRLLERTAGTGRVIWHDASKLFGSA